MKEEKKESPIGVLWGWGKPYHGKFIGSVILAVLGVACQMVPYFCVAHIVTMMLSGEQNFSRYVTAGIIALCGYFGKVLFSCLSTTISHTATYYTLRDLRENITAKLVRIPMGTILDTPSGQYKTTIVDRVEGMEPTFAHLIPEMTANVLVPLVIAVYLFLAGISGGAVAAAVILNLYRKQAHENTPVLKAASVIGAATILLGMVCLVLDLTNPFNFWRILIYYNPTSVMSLGVMALLVYIPTVCILTLVALRGLLPKVGLGFLDGIVGFFDGWRVVLQWIALVFALTICAYTGFLISALIRFPLINQAVLPALFVASGLSAGMAATKAFACLAFGDRHESCDQHLLHAAEWPVMAAEALCIFMIAVALVNGNAAAQAAFAAFTTGAWAIEFWVGVVCVGFCGPLVLGLIGGGLMSFYLSALCSVAGMMCLRLFILYAGQLHGL